MPFRNFFLIHHTIFSNHIFWRVIPYFFRWTISAGSQQRLRHSFLWSGWVAWLGLWRGLVSNSYDHRMTERTRDSNFFVQKERSFQRITILPDINLVLWKSRVPNSPEVSLFFTQATSYPQTEVRPRPSSVDWNDTCFTIPRHAMDGAIIQMRYSTRNIFCSARIY